MSQTSSLKNTELLITVASWEERFLKGMEMLIDDVNPSHILMFHFHEYADWSLSNRDSISRLCKNRGVELQDGMSPLSFQSPVATWRELSDNLEKCASVYNSITIDITTMPRETIWSICHNLEKETKPIQYVYYKPEEYGSWLSRDPDRPRLLYRLAGIQHLDRKSALIVQTGYDVERTKQLVRFYEPHKLVLVLQTGNQFDNPKQNRIKHQDAFCNFRDVEFYDVNGYCFQDSYDKLLEISDGLLPEYNVIVSSLGPKIGALSAFAVKQKLPSLALSYTPSNEFNREYSKGIDARINGFLIEGPVDSDE